MERSFGFDDVKFDDAKNSKNPKKMKREDAKFSKFKKTQRRVDKRARYD